MYLCVLPVEAEIGYLRCLPPLLLSTLFIETASFTEPECSDPPDWLASEHQGSSHLAFYMAAGDLNSGPHACTASTLLNELFPRLPIFFLYSFYSS